MFLNTQNIKPKCYLCDYDFTFRCLTTQQEDSQKNRTVTQMKFHMHLHYFVGSCQVVTINNIEFALKVTKMTKLPNDNISKPDAGIKVKMFVYEQTIKRERDR